VLDVCSINYSTNDTRILSVYVATVTHRLWPWPVKLVLEALEGTVASEVAIPVLSHIPISRSHME
jgi:hypothetical protein